MATPLQFGEELAGSAACTQGQERRSSELPETKVVEEEYVASDQAGLLRWKSHAMLFLAHLLSTGTAELLCGARRGDIGMHA